MLTFHVVIVAALATLGQCQRGSFAGKKPIGYPELLNRTTTTVDPLGNRFGDGDSTTERLPVEANGDRDLVDRISKWPIDKQPFWYLNWKALEDQRKNPQTYPQRPSQFGETPNFNAGSQNSNTGTLNNRFGSNSNTGTLNSNFGTNSNAGTISTAEAPSQNVPGNSDLGSQHSEVPKVGNRNSGIDNNSNIGQRRQVDTGFHSSGFGHYPHNRYGT